MTNAMRKATGVVPPPTGKAEVSVCLFGIFRELAGTAGRDVTLPEGSTVQQLVDALRDEGGMCFLPAAPTVAVNLEYASLQQRLEFGDEVALIPPLAGG